MCNFLAHAPAAVVAHSTIAHHPVAPLGYHGGLGLGGYHGGLGYGNLGYGGKKIYLKKWQRQSIHSNNFPLNYSIFQVCTEAMVVLAMAIHWRMVATMAQLLCIKSNEIVNLFN